MRFFPAILGVVILLSIHVPTSRAGIIGSPTGDIALITPTPFLDLREESYKSDSVITLFAEQQNVILSHTLTFNITKSGTSPGPVDTNLSPGEINAGTPVNSYFVHTESISGTRRAPVELSGSITFKEEVLGIAIFNRRLDESDEPLGLLSSVLYPTNQEREMEISVGGFESVTLSNDRRTVTFDFKNVGGLDQARIVTAAVPECGPLILASVGAMFVAGSRFKRQT